MQNFVNRKPTSPREFLIFSFRLVKNIAVCPVERVEIGHADSVCVSVIIKCFDHKDQLKTRTEN